MQEKTADLDSTFAQTGLNIHRGKTKILSLNTTTNNPVTLREEPLEEVDSFTYLGSIINLQGGTDEDVKARIQKARTAFVILRKVSLELKEDQGPNKAAL